MHALTSRFVGEILRPISRAPLFLTACAMTMASPAWAAPHIVCVNNVTALHTELEKAGESGVNNDADTHINLAVGTYATNNSIFQYGSAKTFTLDITGGYNSDCSKQITQNPIYTVLSGVGSSKLILQSNSMGDVSLRFLTFKGGKVAGGGSALSMNTAGSTGQVIIDYDIFTANQGGSAVDIGYSSLVQLDGNLFYGNVGDLATFFATNTVQFYAINNTFTQNVIFDTADGAYTLAVQGASGFSAAVSNNIFFNNSFTNTHGSTDYDIAMVGSAGSTVQLEKNIAHVVEVLGATATNSDLPGNPDPQFASSTDFHLLPTSPGIAAGTLTPPGGLPSIDIQGNPRTFNGSVDLGAYERGDDIFRDGFGF